MGKVTPKTAPRGGAPKTPKVRGGKLPKVTTISRHRGSGETVVSTRTLQGPTTRGRSRVSPGATDAIEETR